MLLEALGLAKRFGGVHAVADVDLAVGDRQVIGLIGPNGAGKTTPLNVLSRHVRAEAGAIRLAREDITRLAPHASPARGLARTLQDVRLFKALSAFDTGVIG